LEAPKGDETVIELAHRFGVQERRPDVKLFREPADLIVVQHCREMESAVHDLVDTHAQLMPEYESREIQFFAIGGKDSKRLVEAFQDRFCV